MRIARNSYRELTPIQLRKLLKEIHDLRSSHAINMKFHRTYIPKGDTYRPLGVPSLSWRIYSNMLLHPLVMFCRTSKHQHGFKPESGTKTAWQQIFREVIKSKTIYEYDLKQCFPSISLPRLNARLTSLYGMPPYIANYYTCLNYGTPELKGPSLLDETQSYLIDQTMEHNKKYNLIRGTTYHGPFN